MKIPSFNRWIADLRPIKPLKTLFVGNSLTHFAPVLSGQRRVIHDLPGQLLRMTTARNSRPQLEVGRIGGAAADLSEHLSALERECQNARWDYVVLQENTERVLSKASDSRQTICRADAVIRSCGAKTILFSPWAAAGQKKASSALEGFYRSMAAEIAGLFVPVGRAWDEATRLKPELSLRTKDIIHPSPAGSFLTTCVFYCYLFDARGRGDELIREEDAEWVEELRQSQILAPDAGESPMLTKADLAFLWSVAARVASENRPVAGGR